MSEKLCLQWNDFKDNIKTAFGNLREDIDFSDVTLACEDGQQIKAHKVILAASSPFFQNILKRNQHPHLLIYMRGLKSEDLVAIVDFLYFGEANVFQENLDSFFAIAEELQLRGLTGQNDDQPNGISQNDLMAPRICLGDSKMPKSERDKSMHVENLLTNVTETVNKTVALTSFGSGEYEELTEQVKSMMEKTQSATPDGKRRLYVCKVCGKEGQSIHVQYHIESKHLEGVSLPCNFCGKRFRSRKALQIHKKHYHKSQLNLNSNQLIHSS